MAFFLGLAAPASAECDKRDSLQVIVTVFEIKHDLLRAKLKKTNRPKFEKEMSEALADRLRCEKDLRFVQWSDEVGSGSQHAGTLHAAMDLDGSPPAAIKLVLTLTPKGLEPIEIPDPLGALYHSEDTQEPGEEGQLWKKQLRRRVLDLTENQGFRRTLQKALFVIPLVRSDDIFFRQAEDVIGLPLNPYHLQAGSGSRLRLDFQLKAPNTPNRHAELWSNPFQLHDEWEKRVQCGLETNPQIKRSGQIRSWTELGPLWSNRAPEIIPQVSLQEYVWGDPKVDNNLQRIIRKSP